MLEQIYVPLPGGVGNRVPYAECVFFSEGSYRKFRCVSESYPYALYYTSAECSVSDYDFLDYLEDGDCDGNGLKTTCASSGE